MRQAAKARNCVVYDALHGCGAGYLDRALADHGIRRAQPFAPSAMCCSTAPAPTSPKKISRRSRKAVLEQKAHVGLATDGDADRFGIVDARRHMDFAESHSRACCTTIWSKSRGWKLDAARSVATSHLIDAVAKCTATKFIRRPWDSNISAS